MQSQTNEHHSHRLERLGQGLIEIRAKLDSWPQTPEIAEITGRLASMIQIANAPSALLDIDITHQPAAKSPLGLMNHIEAQALAIASLSEGAFTVMQRFNDFEDNPDATALHHVGTTTLALIDLRTESLLTSLGDLGKMSAELAAAELIGLREERRHVKNGKN